MTKDELTHRLAVVMATLIDPQFPSAPVPASSIYLALDSRMEDYIQLTSVGERMGWLRVTSQTIALTDSGRKQAEKFAAIFARRS